MYTKLFHTSFTYPLTSGKERMGEGWSACYQCWPLILEPWVTYTVYLIVIKYNSGSWKITHSSTFNVRPKTTSGLFRKWVNPGTAGVTKRGGIYHRSCGTLVQRTCGFYPTLSYGMGLEVGEFHSETALLIHNKDGFRDWEICHSQQAINIWWIPW